MPGGRKMIWVNGRRASVPEDQLENTLRGLDSGGIKFSLDDPSGGGPEAQMTVGEPEVIKSQHGASGEWGEDQDMGFMEKFAQGGSDALRGLNSGLYMGGSDEVEALSPGRTLEQARASNAEAEQRSPWLYNGAKVAGYIPGMLMAPAGAAARVGVAGLEGIASGALSSDSNDAKETVEDSLMGGLIGGVTSGATELGAQAWGGMKNLGSKAVDWADELRNGALGGTASDFQKLARTEGLDYVEGGPGREARRLGLTNKVIPQSPSTYAHKSAEMMRGVGQEKSAALAEADQYLGTHVPTDDLAQGIERRGVGQAADATPEGQAEQARLQQMAELLRQKQGPMLPPSELDAQKQAYYRRGYQQDKIPDSNAQLGAESNRMAGAESRDQLNDAMQYAPPELNARLQSANQDYGELATMNTMSQNRAAGLQAAPSGGVFSTLTSPAATALKKYGPDLAANMTNLAGEGMQAVGRPMQSGALAAGRVPMGPAAGAMQGPAMPPPPMPAGPSGQQQSNNGLPGSTRGYLTPDVAKSMLQKNPQAFGPYTQQFNQAQQSGDPGEMVRLLDRLENTDDRWKQQYLPMLLGQTGGQM